MKIKNRRRLLEEVIKAKLNKSDNVEKINADGRQKRFHFFNETLYKYREYKKNRNDKEIQKKSRDIIDYNKGKGHI